MKSLFERFMGGTPTTHSAEHSADDEGFFSTQFMERPDSFRAASAWMARALGVGAHGIDKEHGLAALDQVWGKDHFFAALDPVEKRKLLDYLDFVTVPAGRELIVQEEKGDYALILLHGVVAVDRIQPTGVRARLAEARDGDVLGEMSLVDAGVRFASCVTLSTPGHGAHGLHGPATLPQNPAAERTPGCLAGQSGRGRFGGPSLAPDSPTYIPPPGLALKSSPSTHRFGTAHGTRSGLEIHQRLAAPDGHARRL